MGRLGGPDLFDCEEGLDEVDGLGVEVIRMGVDSPPLDGKREGYE